MAGKVIKVIHLADTHLDPTARYLGPKEYIRRGDFLQAFKYAVDKNLEIRPDLLLISGDLFDRVNPRNPARTYVMKALRRLHHEGIKIYAIGGNHDTPRSVEEGASPLHELEAAGYIEFFSTVKEMKADFINIQDFQVCISGASYNHTFSLDTDPLEIMKIPCDGDINIAMLHYNFSSVKVPEIWRAPTIKETNVPSSLHYLALGHFHRFYRGSLGKTLIVYPGSTERRSFAEENDEKGFVYFTITENGVENLEFINTNPRPLKTLEITIKEMEKHPVEKVISIAKRFADNRTILRLKIKGQLPLDQLTTYNRNQVLHQLKDHFFHVIIDDLALEFFLEQPEFESLQTRSPLELYEEYLTNLLRDIGVKDERKKVLKEALIIGRKLLEEAGAW